MQTKRKQNRGLICSIGLQVRNIKYDTLKLQTYLKSSALTQCEKKTLTSFRSQCTRGIQSNFRKMYKTLQCPLLCEEVQTDDTQDHILTCKKLNIHKQNAQLSHIYGTLEEQEKVAKIITKHMRKINIILNNIEQSTQNS